MEEGMVEILSVCGLQSLELSPMNPKSFKQLLKSIDEVRNMQGRLFTKEEQTLFEAHKNKKFKRVGEAMTKQPKVKCECRHDESYHTGALGDCLFVHANDKYCQCPEYRPTKPLKRKGK